MTKPSPASSTDGSIDHSMKKEELRQGLSPQRECVFRVCGLLNVIYEAADPDPALSRFRDIKPVNLLLDIEVFSDCENSKILHQPVYQTNPTTHQHRGTPEMVEKKEHDYAVDNWTLG
ncbi:hypothetical protein OPV22_020673 [Ensete ventricosum]|uniref:Protein kinase domain-containing protein n=1 Tax=Ensete ventricosum TaxID=4639 RepID=A0AAV8PA48_ENSVE|nr:hypothetical protein OPV22_020673 [Ensete ventricosum]